MKDYVEPRPLLLAEDHHRQSFDLEETMQTCGRVNSKPTRGIENEGRKLAHYHLVDVH